MHHGELRVGGERMREGLLGDWSLCWRVCGGPKEVGSVLDWVLSGSRGTQTIGQYFSPRRREKQSQSQVRQEGMLLTSGWLSPPLLGCDERVFAFCSFPHHPKRSSSDTDVLGSCVCLGCSGTAWPGARGQLSAVVQQECFFLFPSLLQILFSSAGLSLGGKSPASNLPGGKEAWSLLPAWVRGGMSIVRKQDFICGQVFPASQA